MVSGQWRFASGCKGADWIGVGIGGTPANSGDAGAGKPFTAVFPAHEVEIVENWNVVGMQGTGSHDLRLRDKFVDEQWTFVRGGAALIDEPLYRYPAVAYQAQVHAAVNIGLARAALDLLTDMSGSTKTTTGAPRLADRGYYRSGLAKAEANWRSARAFFYESAEAAWQTIIDGDPVSQEQANLLRLSATHAAQIGAEVVMQAYQMAGIAAIYRENRLAASRAGFDRRDAACVSRRRHVRRIRRAVRRRAAGHAFSVTPLRPASCHAKGKDRDDRRHQKAFPRCDGVPAGRRQHHHHGRTRRPLRHHRKRGVLGDGRAADHARLYQSGQLCARRSASQPQRVHQCAGRRVPGTSRVISPA